ncbi:hypothetical protein Sjap_026310 [Stephania japonica]|uniref:Uncharacterized protein n=1 Tax=Stephania japonica TaxID=461633 RepID=A0AAP0EB75_9MAGN
MNMPRKTSSPELFPSSSFIQRSSDSSLEGMSANIKLLLKLIQEHNETGQKDNEGRQRQRVAEMLIIVEDAKSRIQKSQLNVKKKPELRRCNTELKPLNGPREAKTQEPITDEKEILRHELNNCLAVRKSLEKMISSVGKEKEIMAAELARKVHELNAMEEHLNDLKAQNEMLLTKVQTCAAEHKERNVDTQGNVLLQERNKELSEKLLKSLDRYKSLKKRLKDSQEEKARIQSDTLEIVEDVTKGLNRIHDVQQHFTERNEQPEVIKVQLSALADMFHCVEIKLSKHVPKRSESAQIKSDGESLKPLSDERR